jgi:hypothetical protein
MIDILSSRLSQWLDAEQHLFDTMPYEKVYKKNGRLKKRAGEIEDVIKSLTSAISQVENAASSISYASSYSQLKDNPF